MKNANMFGFMDDEQLKNAQDVAGKILSCITIDENGEYQMTGGGVRFNVNKCDGCTLADCIKDRQMTEQQLNDMRKRIDETLQK